MPVAHNHKPARSPARRVLAYFALAVLVLAVLFGGLFAFLALRPDAPPFDDSAMLPSRPNVPEGQNGFEPLLKALHAHDDFVKSDFYQDIGNAFYNRRDFRNIKGNNLQNLQKKYQTAYQDSSGILKSYEYFIAPEYVFKVVVRESRVNYLCFREMARYAMVLAWHEARTINPGRAVSHIEFALKVGSVLMHSHGTLSQLMIGVADQQLALEEANAMIEQGLLPQPALLQLSQILKDNAPSPENWIQPVKSEYYFAKDYLFKPLTTKQLAGNSLEMSIDKAVFKPQLYIASMYPFYEVLIVMENKPLKEFNGNSDTYGCNKSTFSQWISWILSPSSSIGRQLGCKMFPNFARAGKRHIVHRVQYDLLTVKLAALMYREEHGALPETLDALVPEYLDAVPADLMDGAALRYDPARALVWSVGLDFKDDHGAADAYILEWDPASLAPDEPGRKNEKPKKGKSGSSGKSDPRITDPNNQKSGDMVLRIDPEMPNK